MIRLITCLLFSGFALAQPVYLLRNIEPQLHDFITHSANLKNQGDLQVTVKSLDSRIAAKRCLKPFDINWSQHRPVQMIGRQSLIVACNDQQPWKVYVPVQIQQYLTIAVSRQAITREAPLTLENISSERRLVGNAFHRYIIYTPDLVGKIARRSLAANQPLLLNSLKEAQIIQRGQEVIIKSGSNNIQIMATGIALASATAGQRVRVENKTSKRIIEAYVVDQHTVTIH